MQIAFLNLLLSGFVKARMLQVPWYSATLCNTLQHSATLCNTLQHSATRCNTLQHSATLCNTLQHSATLCNTLQHTTRQHTHDTTPPWIAQKCDLCPRLDYICSRQLINTFIQMRSVCTTRLYLFTTRLYLLTTTRKHIHPNAICVHD